MSSTPPSVRTPREPDADASLTTPARRARPRRTLQCQVTLDLADGKGARHGTMQDISPSGLSLTTDRPIEPGSKCHLVLDLTATGAGVVLEATAKSVYSSYLAPRQFRIGMVFTQLDTGGQNLLQSLFD